MEFAGGRIIRLQDDFLLNYEPLSSLSVLIWLRPNESKTTSLWSYSHYCLSVTANLIKG